MPLRFTTTGGTHLPALKGSLAAAGDIHPPPGRVRIVSTATSSAVEAWVSQPFIPVGSDVGGWQIAARDADTGIPEYVGTDPERWAGGLRFDAYTTRTDLAPTIDQFLAMGKPVGPGLRPSTVRVVGSVPLAVSKQGRFWLIDSATPAAEGVVDSPSGPIYRMDIAVTLLAPAVASTVTAPKLAKAGSGKSSRTVLANAGESLLHLLIRTVGNTAGWHDVAARNGIRDPTAKLKKGQKVRV